MGDIDVEGEVFVHDKIPSRSYEFNSESTQSLGRIPALLLPSDFTVPEDDDEETSVSASLANPIILNINPTIDQHAGVRKVIHAVADSPAAVVEPSMPMDEASFESISLMSQSTLLLSSGLTLTSSLPPVQESSTPAVADAQVVEEVTSRDPTVEIIAQMVVEEPACETLSPQPLQPDKSVDYSNYSPETARRLEAEEKARRKAARKEEKRRQKEALELKRKREERLAERQAKLDRLLDEQEKLKATLQEELDKKRTEKSATLSALEQELEQKCAVVLAAEDALDSDNDDEDSGLDDVVVQKPNKANAQTVQTVHVQKNAEVRTEVAGSPAAATGVAGGVGVGSNSGQNLSSGSGSVGAGIPGKKKVVLKKRLTDGLGFWIEPTGRYGIVSSVFISHIYPGTVASKCGQLGVGDIILAVNGVSLVGGTAAQSLALLEQASKLTEVALDVIPEEPVRVHYLDKNMSPNGRLGFDVLRGDIIKVVSGGAAEAAGMRVGDHIIEVNKVSTARMSHEEIVGHLRADTLTLRTMPGTLYNLVAPNGTL
eukprot:comp47738_c0_seq1/m.47611 comp47738_c0_seq1/g.47611  ORF comp47738_c0_seq1/g.47611 comp47738_c0_seq1/m.47611 type:complete len:543 (-) comp47738_c0_seq1:231-1859(-)